MFMEEMQAPLEALLFARGEPVTAAQLREILQVDEESLTELLALYEKTLAERGSGIMLHRVAGGFQLVTRPELHAYVQKLTEVQDRKLSTPALETLSIVAFKQPITKQEVEHIRGVRVERALQRLLEMELIEEVGRKPVIGRPILYGTTDVFLKCFGLNALSDLPDLPALEEVMQEGDVQIELIAADEAAQGQELTEVAAGEMTTDTSEEVENTEPLAKDLHSEEKSD